MKNYNSDITSLNYFGHALDETERKRLKKFRKQRNKKGFDGSEVWNLDYTILSFILPRLKCFSNTAMGYPTVFKDKKSWNNAVKDMIFWMEEYIKDPPWVIHTYHPKQKISKKRKKKVKRFIRGNKYFFKYFSSLWD